MICSIGSGTGQTHGYDTDGNLVAINQTSGSGNAAPTSSFVNDLFGQILEDSRTGGPNGDSTLKQLIVNGAVEGQYGSNSPSNFSLSYTRIADTSPAPEAGEYVVQPGDTLQSIALAAYGDQSLWYLIAQANGLSSDQDLHAGQSLVIPTAVGGVHNNAGTTAPFNRRAMQEIG
jgi:LysM repeat protein